MPCRDYNLQVTLLEICALFVLYVAVRTIGHSGSLERVPFYSPHQNAQICLVGTLLGKACHFFGYKNINILKGKHLRLHSCNFLTYMYVQCTYMYSATFTM